MWGSDDFGALLLAAAQGALPYIGGAVVAGVVLLAVLLGIRLALRVLSNFVADRNAMSDEEWERENGDQERADYQEERYRGYLDRGWDEDRAWNESQMDAYLD